VCELCCPPTPVSAIDTVPPVLPIVIDPIPDPATDGANVTFRAAVCPGVNVVLALAPLTLKPAPAAITLESVTFAFPLFVSVTPSEAVVPTKTLPKSKLLVLELKSAVDAKAVPLVEIINGDPGALLASEITPTLFPAELGANTMLNVALCPAAILIGRTSPDVPKPAPLTFAAEIVTLALPPFCNVIVCELLDPAVTIGKLALIGVAESCACGVFVGVGVAGIAGAVGTLLLAEGFDPITTPAQPLPISEPASTNATKLFCVLLTSGHRPDPCRDLCSAIVPQV
jgi:hypothetical protein